MDCSLITLYFAANILIGVSTYNVFFSCVWVTSLSIIFFLVLALQIFWYNFFHSWIILHSVNVHFLYSLFDWGASRLFPCSGYCQKHCNDHNWGSVFVECLSFLRYIPKSGTDSDLEVNWIPIFWETSILISKVAVQACTTTSSGGVFCFT